MLLKGRTCVINIVGVVEIGGEIRVGEAESGSADKEGGRRADGVAEGEGGLRVVNIAIMSGERKRCGI